MWRELKMKILAEQVLKTQVLICGVLLYLSLPPGWDASSSQGYPPAVCCQYQFKHLGDEGQCGVKFLV